MSKLYLSVVIPAYNETDNFQRGVLDQVYTYLHKQDYPWEVLIVDDQSTDSTAEIAERFASTHEGFRVLREPHRGKAGTVIAGMLKAKAEYILFTDADQATPLKEVEKMFPKLEQGFDIVIASRTGRKGASMVRKIMTLGFVILRTIILRMPYKDTQCGFKIFTKQASEKLFNKLNELRGKETIKGYTVTAGFDLELLYLARKAGYKVAEVPVEWEDRQQGRKVNPIKDSWIGLRGMLQVRLNALEGKYNI